MAEKIQSLLDTEAAEPVQTELNNDVTACQADEVYDIEEYECAPATVRPEPKAITLTPEIKAEIVFENFIRNSNRVFSGKERRALHRECLRNAKRGRYDYMFDPEKLRKREERDKARFDKLNAPAKHTVDEIPEDVQKTLLDMVDKEPWIGPCEGDLANS